ncbi:MAG: hypothetical protein H0T52_03215, partial [Lautropia sp.]|nr:hypothetical protein [Lautropia sp.]
MPVPQLPQEICCCFFMSTPDLRPVRWRRSLGGKDQHDWHAGAFRHRFASTDRRLRLISAVHNLRCRLTRIYFGDQAIFVRRSLFEKLGGFPVVPVLEDVIFCERLRRVTRSVMLRSAVTTDPRRFLHHGIWRTSFRALAILARHSL